MATIEEIDQEKTEAVNILNQQIEDAIRQKNSASGEQEEALDRAVTALMAKRTEITTQAYLGALRSAEMAAALAKLKKATTTMRDTAESMKSVTAFLAKLSEFLGAANTVIGALKGN